MKIKNICITICLIILFLFVNRVRAADWTLLAAYADGDMYYFLSTIKSEKENIVSVWTKTVFNEKGRAEAFSSLKSKNKTAVPAGKLSHNLVLYEMDCLNGKYRVSALYYYDEKDNLVYSEKNTGIQFSDILHDTILGKLKNAVCPAGGDAPKQKN